MFSFLNDKSASIISTHCVAMIEPLEQRQLLSVTINPENIKVRNLSVDGLSINQSQLTVPFTDTVQIGDASKIRMIGYVVNPVGGAQKKVTVQLSDIQIIEAAPNHITFVTDRLSPRSGRIIIDDGGILLANGDSAGEFNVQPPKGQNKERFTLASRAFRATDITIYSQAVNPNSPAVPNLTSNLPLHQVEPFLISFLDKKVNLGIITAAKRDEAMALFNDSFVQQIFPNHNLRAALVSLVGTVGEPAIAAYLEGQNITGHPFTVVDFSEEVSDDAVVAETLQKQFRLRTLFKLQFRGEPFQVLSAYLAHEALHQDGDNGQQEEIVTNTVETMVYIQQAMAFRGFIFTPSNLTRNQNDKVLAMLNSGSASFPRVGLTDAVLLNDNGVFYQAPTQAGGPVSSFEDHIRRQYVERGFLDINTAGNQTLNAMYTLITGKTATNISFNRTLIADIDANQIVISDRDAIAVAGLFGLTYWLA